MSVNTVIVEEIPDKPISIGQLWHFEHRVAQVIKITVPKDDSIDFEKEYFAISSLETGWVGLLSESLKELKDKLFDDSYEQVKSKVTITPGN
jgi:hypothetical protein